MSSRVYLPDDPRPVQPLMWRQVQLEVKAPVANEGAAVDEEKFRARLEMIEKRCEQKVHEARAAGQREGETTGRSRAAAEFQPVIERFCRTIEDLSGMRARLRREAEADLLRLSLAIARRVLRRELSIDPEALHGLVLAALEKIEGQELCRVRVHPSHVAPVSECLRNCAGTSKTLEVLGDPSQEPGAAIFETERGNLDASVESQLGEIERGLTDCLRKRG